MVKKADQATWYLLILGLRKHNFCKDQITLPPYSSHNNARLSSHLVLRKFTAPAMTACRDFFDQPMEQMLNKGSV